MAFEGFTGKSYLFREEFTSRIWATRYDFPAITRRARQARRLPDDTPSGAQGWFFNTRREKFKDRRLREAFVYAFDFEWTNKTIMYGAYERTHSLFQNSDMMAAGKPERGRTCAARAVPRQGAGRGVRRSPSCRRYRTDRVRTARCCARRVRCCRRPDYLIKNGKRVTPNGERIVVEFLIDEPTFQPHHMPFIKT